jgi:hypothetical protein
VSLQDGALLSSESFAQLPPVRIVDNEQLNLSHRVNSILQRAETVSGLDLSQNQIEGPLPIMENGESHQSDHTQTNNKHNLTNNISKFFSKILYLNLKTLFFKLLSGQNEIVGYNFQHLANRRKF